MTDNNDTITALATPRGIGGLSVIRISGKKAIEIADKVFRGKTRLLKAKTFTAHFGKIIDGEKNIIDEVIATVYREPGSYTAENMVEISTHGGIYIPRLLLKILVEAGARPAEPGEFTKRAFLNGRIDLTQAEAVAEVIQATSEHAHRSSIQQLEGRLSKEINFLREKLLNLSSTLEVELEFVEEGIELTDRNKIKEEILSISRKLKEMIRSYKLGRVYRDGVKIVITGKTNVGKSSILNNLLNENRAIVTDFHGTTRDTIEENVSWGGILFKIIDTAGVRLSKNPVEMEGISRTKKQIETADIVVFVVDPSQGFKKEDRDIFEIVRKSEKLKNVILVINKIDLNLKIERFIKFSETKHLPLIKLSTKNGSGFNELREGINYCVEKLSGNLSETGLIIISERHIEILKRSLHTLSNSLHSVENKASNEFILLDIRLCIDQLGEIIGVIKTEDILNKIFSRFCIGK